MGAREKGAFSEWEPETAQEESAERQRENEVGGQEETQGEKLVKRSVKNPVKISNILNQGNKERIKENRLKQI